MSERKTRGTAIPDYFIAMCALVLIAVLLYGQREARSRLSALEALHKEAPDE